MLRVSILALSVCVLHAQQEDYRLTAQANLVILDVSVRDPAGRFVSDLKKSDFRVVENGKPRTISDFSHDDEPVTVGLVIDNSGSMRGKRDAVNRAAIAFLDASNANDEIFITRFNDSVSRSLPKQILFTDNRTLLMRSLERGPSQGRTALYDGVVESLRLLELGKQTRKSLLLVSDGGDNTSINRLADVIEALRGSFATIYTIGIYDPEDPDRNPGVLRRLAEISGGEAFFPKDLDDIQRICRQIALDIRNRYTLAYTPSEADSKALRKIRVEVNSPEHPKLIVHARTSYVFPAVTPVSDKKVRP